MPSSTGACRAARPAGTHVPWLDRLAIGAASACLVHCLMLPARIAAIPMLTQLIGASEQFHLYAFAAAAPVSALAMGRGFNRHGLRLPLVLAIVGLALLGSGIPISLPRLIETSLTLAGSEVLAIAHLQNAGPPILPQHRHQPGAARPRDRSTFQRGKL